MYRKKRTKGYSIGWYVSRKRRSQRDSCSLVLDLGRSPMILMHSPHHGALPDQLLAYVHESKQKNEKMQEEMGDIV